MDPPYGGSAIVTVTKTLIRRDTGDTHSPYAFSYGSRAFLRLPPRLYHYTAGSPPSHLFSPSARLDLLLLYIFVSSGGFAGSVSPALPSPMSSAAPPSRPRVLASREQRWWLSESFTVCVSIFIKLHITAQPGCRTIPSMLLVWILSLIHI